MDRQVCRGVAVEWLIAFTDEHDCWDWQTNRVSPQCEVQCIRFATDCDAHVTKAAFLRCDATRRDASLWLGHCCTLARPHAETELLSHAPQVRDDIVFPLTAPTRCRFTELPAVASAVMRAQFFVSHAWAASWGDLVVACTTMLPAGAIVWVDIFAVRQWPGNAMDLAFHAVVKRCACEQQTARRDFSQSAPLGSLRATGFARYS
jgi:hypothetical protein